MRRKTSVGDVVWKVCDKSVKFCVCIAKVAKKLILEAILDFIIYLFTVITFSIAFSMPENIGIEVLLTFVA